MNKQHPHNDIIEKKLEQLPGADADGLWHDMRAILDKKMPQKKERRRFIAWLLISKPFLLLLVGFIIGTGSSLFFLSRKDNSVATTKTLADNPQISKVAQNDNANKNGVNETSETKKQIATDLLLPNEKTSNEVSITTAPRNAGPHVINTNSLTLQPNTRSEKNPFGNFNEPIQESSKARPGFDIDPVYLNSINEILLSTNINEVKNLVSLELPSSNAKLKGQRNNELGFYTGVVSGIDLSSVGFRSPKAGSTKGFIVGYSLNDKWSIESGLLWDTKRVSDNGDHFTPPGYTPSSGIKIIAVNGKSRLYEWPINMKYSILTGNHRLFTTAGLSSYFMRMENYDYEYTQNNQPGGHNYLSYKNETKNWFSVVNFSIGYSHKLGSLGTFRLEPYLKLPLKDLGVGKLPIMSTGLNIGFTKTVR